MAWVEEEEEWEEEEGSDWRKGEKRERKGKVKATRIRDGAALAHRAAAFLIE